MSSRFPSHKLSNGLYVSGRPEQQPKERPPTMSSTSMPYTGGDIKKSGELGKMFDISMDGSRPRKSGPINSAPSRSGSFGGATSHLSQLTPNSLNRMGSLSSVPNSASLKITSSGPLNKHGEPLTRASGPQGGGTNFVSRQNSGPLPPVLPATGLITSGPIISGPLNATGGPRTKASGPLDSSGSLKPNSSVLQNHTVTRLSQENEYSFFKNFPKLIFWSIILLFAVGFLAGTFIFAAVGNPILFAVVIVLFVAVTSVFVWNSCWGTRAITSFISQYPDCDLKTATSGQFIKVSGVVTCGNVPLETSFQKVSRCVYTSTSLYEYRGWDSKAANPSHRPFTWGLRSLERHVVDFYVSDFQSGLRVLVKAGSGAKVTPYVNEQMVVDINMDLSPEFIRWLQQRKLYGDDRVVRLKEGYIKEGSTISVMGVLQRNDNVLTIVAPAEPVPTGCQWSKCILPASLEGIVLRCDDSSKIDAIPV